MECVKCRVWFECPFDEDFEIGNLFVGPFDETIYFDIGHDALQ